MTPLSEARRQAEEALAAYDRCKGYEAYTYAFDCVRPLRALLAALGDFLDLHDDEPNRPSVAFSLAAFDAIPLGTEPYDGDIESRLAECERQRDHLRASMLCVIQAAIISSCRAGADAKQMLDFVNESFVYLKEVKGPLRPVPADDALLAALPAEPAPPMDDDIEHPCGCYAPDGDRCWRHAKPPRPAQDAVREAAEMLRATDVEWVVNSLAELGVKIGEQFFFLYKGESLVYKRDDHEPGEPPLMWRYVGKREFGECCHPINDADPTRYGTVDVADGREWRPLLAAIDGRKP